MDGFTEKKWFVYLIDHHEGPFSFEDFHDKFTQGSVSMDHFVWKEGMADWAPMKSIEEFQNLFAPRQPPPPHEVVPPAFHQAAESQPSPPPVQEEKTGELTLREQEEVDVASGAGQKKSRFRLPFKPLSRRFVVMSFLFFGFAALVSNWNEATFESILQQLSLQETFEQTREQLRPHLVSLSQSLPILQDWISPLPPIQDVSPTDYETLKAAARADIKTDGIRVAIALSQHELQTPSFYIGSNLPDNAKFHFYIVGIPDTLVGTKGNLLSQLSVTTHTQAVLSKKLGKTSVVKNIDNHILSRGEYLVYVTLADSQPPEIKNLLAGFQSALHPAPEQLPKDTKVLLQKAVFLGGAKDDSYRQQLKEFHDLLKSKAIEEIRETKQFGLTLESQLFSTLTKFSLLRKSRITSSQRKIWEQFHQQWTKLETQLDQIFQKWTPEYQHQNFFYEPLYRLTRQAGQAVNRVHEFHHAYFIGVRDPKTFEIQLGEAVASAQTQLGLLKAKADQLEKLPPSKAGMPGRENL